MSSKRILDAELEYDCDCRRRHDDELFTGIAYALYDDGQLKYEKMYEEGVQSGTSRYWYSTGRLRKVTQMCNDVVNGEKREWDVCGNLRRWLRAEMGITREEKVWSQSGELLSEYQDIESTDGCR